MNELVLVLDFGGQYKELIARSVRSLNVYSEIKPGHLSANEIKKLSPIGIILTGGPNSVYLPGSPKCDPEIFKLGIPVLGICYGMQIMCHMAGGEVLKASKGEYGTVNAVLNKDSVLFMNLPEKSRVLMSHRDYVGTLPEGFVGIGKTADCANAACECVGSNLYGVQFHPESEHTDIGKQILRNFLYDICHASGDYRLDDYIDLQMSQIRKKLGDNKVVLALSGGVDSSVCASLISKAVPGQTGASIHSC
jgi:GMP synthase (glutamine-hydrolysing)